MSKNHNTALRFISSIPWLLTSEWLDIILDIAAGEYITKELVEARSGKPLEKTRQVMQRDNVAVVPIHSVIFRRAGMFDDICAVSSTEQIAQDVQTSVDNSEISDIILDIDSPGGEANGIFELARFIREMSQVKNIVAYTGNMAASAAYAIAISANKFYVHPTAVVGSIGVVAVADTSERPNRKKFTSENSPLKALSPSSETGAALLQKEINKLSEHFVQWVAEARGVSVETVLNDFGKGATLMADEAVPVGMADDYSTFEGVISLLQQKNKPAMPGSLAVYKGVVANFAAAIPTKQIKIKEISII